MNDTIRLGRVAGIPVGMHWSVLLVGLALAGLLALRVLPSFAPAASAGAVWTAAIIGTLLFFGSLLAHEFGHAVVARRHGVGVLGLTLWVLGGVAKLSRQAPTPRAEFQIAAAGPGANMVGTAVFGFAAWFSHSQGDWPLATATAVWLAAANGLVAVTNLAPGAPLDGGRILAAYLWHRGGHAERARRSAARVGVILGLVVALVGVIELIQFSRQAGWWTLAVGLFIAGAARSEIAAAAIRGRLDDTTVGTLMVAYPDAVPDGATAEQFLAWSLRQPRPTAVPITRWSNEPLGYLTPSMVGHLTALQRSATPVGQLMLPSAAAPRAWHHESIATVLERLDVSLPSVVVVHEPRSGHAVGTISDEQILTLFRPPDWWGRDRAAADRPNPAADAIPAVGVGARSQGPAHP